MIPRTSRSRVSIAQASRIRRVPAGALARFRLSSTFGACLGDDAVAASTIYVCKATRGSAVRRRSAIWVAVADLVVLRESNALLGHGPKNGLANAERQRSSVVGQGNRDHRVRVEPGAYGVEDFADGS